MKDVSAEEGLIAIGYENKYGEFSRLYQLTKLFMYHPSSGLYTWYFHFFSKLTVIDWL